MTAEEQAEYTKHIDKYLRTCNLEKVTKGEVREALQDAVNKDLSSQRVYISRIPAASVTDTMIFAESHQASH